MKGGVGVEDKGRQKDVDVVNLVKRCSTISSKTYESKGSICGFSPEFSETLLAYESIKAVRISPCNHTNIHRYTHQHYGAFYPEQPQLLPSLVFVYRPVLPSPTWWPR